MKNRSNGTKIRIEKNRSYTTMSNYHLFDRNLSFKAKGLLSFMLCVPDTWEFSVKGLAAMAKDGIDSITTSLRELEGCGYIERHRNRNEKGQVMGTEYIIYEKPVNIEKNISESSMFAETDIETTTVSYDYTESESFKPIAAKKQAEPCCNYCLESKTESYVRTEITFEEPFSAMPFSETPVRENPVKVKPTQINNKLNKIINKVSNNSIYSSQKKDRDRYEMSGRISAYSSNEEGYLLYENKICEIKDNLNYDDVLKEQCTGSEIEIVDYMIDIMAQTMLSDSQTIRIGRQNLSSVVVKKRFNDLWYDDILYVLDRLSKAQTEVKNIKNYMLTALYNAPSDSSFTAAEKYRNIKKADLFNSSIGRSYDEFDPVNMALRLTEEIEPHMPI